MVDVRARLVIVATLLLAAAACGSPSVHPTAAGGNATLVRVVDGDTLKVTIAGHSDRVRLIGIDTPESVKPNSAVECFAREASDHMKALLPAGTALRLVRDVDARDKYRRLLAYVYRANDGLFVNLAMAKEGYATTLTYPPNVAHVDELVAAVGAARQANRGLWGRCGGAHIQLRSAV
jgi:micrococcal nuclease